LLEKFIQDVKCKLDAIPPPAQENCMPRSPQALLLVDFMDSSFNEILQNSASQIFGHCSPRLRSGKIMNPALHLAEKKRRKAYKEWNKKRHDTTLYERYREAKRDERKQIRIAGKESFLRFSNDMNEKSTCEKAKILRNMRLSRTRTTEAGLHTDRKSIVSYATHFRKMYKEEIEGLSETTRLPVWHADEATSSLEIEESTVLRTLETLTNGKAPGPRNLHNELLKCCATAIAPYLTRLFNAVLATAICPTAWRKGMIHPVFKKGNRTSIENYRPIVVLDMVRRVFEKCLLTDHLLAIIEPLDICQGGFRSQNFAFFLYFRFLETRKLQYYK
jgi:hypothetical protein